MPDICKCNQGILFRADLLDTIFPAKPGELEFLPVLVDGNDWLLINCLKTTRDYDESKSQLFRRGINKQIFMINYLVIHDKSVANVGLFTLEDSNRASIFATEPFVDRINLLNLKGMSFKEIGYISEKS